jgi:Protein of unknown function (DUF3024)
MAIGGSHTPSTSPGLGWSACLRPAGLDRIGGGEFRANQHQRRFGVVRLGNGCQSEVGDRAGAKHQAVPRLDPIPDRPPALHQTTGLWTLYWRDRNLKYHRYEPLDPSPQVQDLLDYLDDRADPIFWG